MLIEPKEGQLCRFSMFESLSEDVSYVGELKYIKTRGYGKQKKTVYFLDEDNRDGDGGFDYCQPLTRKDIIKYMERVNEN